MYLINRVQPVSFLILAPILFSYSVGVGVGPTPWPLALSRLLLNSFHIFPYICCNCMGLENNVGP